jgi:hypothetical protein
MSYPHLQGRVFWLGRIRYVVAKQQPDPHLTRCYRLDGKLVSIVRLPLAFVLERLADEIVLEAPA